MLYKWLTWQKRIQNVYTHFEVIDIDEICNLLPETKSYISGIFLEAKIDPNYLEAMADVLGWSDVKELIIRKGIPQLVNVKRGEFGEILMCAMLEQFHNYKVPIFKLRFKQIANETLHGTDILALVIDDSGLISEMCYIESKLRTDNSKMTVAIDGYSQLKSDYEDKLPQTLSFVAQRLFEQRHDKSANSLFNAFRLYMEDRTDTTDKDSFRLSLCWDDKMWREKVLENLQENGVELPNLSVHVARIEDLRQVTDEIFAEIGIKEVIDDE